jgi:hypothetical protein
MIIAREVPENANQLLKMCFGVGNVVGIPDGAIFAFHLSSALSLSN